MSEVIAGLRIQEDPSVMDTIEDEVCIVVRTGLKEFRAVTWQQVKNET